ncbi:hypothetical protein SAMN05443633_101569 [Chryseobacterium arachidis]|uniref:Uncharacterized protein n=1 Tax=Chryseobacterium arachidis TaxID=1416778 RepID=A0A1M4UQ65_9FLAO|nr:hypothetical protein [Chryseobacterium arachidis]SHE58815.1 hypothetical protein SAMN05443633_101569 [Chryseobacterium arachidis]
MVKKNVLRKLSDSELEKYLIFGNRFTPEAVEAAFEILQERGRYFNDQDKVSVQNLIQDKKQEEENRQNEEKEVWKDHITEDPDTVKLHSLTTILIISLLFSTIPGSALLFLNFITVKKYIPAIFTLLIGFGFFFVQNYILQSFFDINTSSRYSPEMGIIALGAIILLVISVTMMPPKLPYRSKSLVLPVILAMIMIIFMYLNFQHWFSAYPIISVFSLLKNF